MNKCLILIESPLQLLNAYEAIKHFNIIDFTLYIRFSCVETNDSQIKKLINILDIKKENIRSVYIKPNNKGMSDLLSIILVLFKLSLFNRIYNQLYIGNYESKFIKIVTMLYKRERFFLLDDGNKSIRIQSEFKSSTYVDMFTMFDLKPIGNQIVIKNNYKYTKELISNNTSDSKTVLFIGSGMSEIEIVSQEYYLQLMSLISDYYKSSSLNMLYIPHRAECVDKLDKIRLIDNIDVFPIDYPIELFGVCEGIMPVRISSFCSTAILTLRAIYGCQAECFLFDYESHADKQELDGIYEYYAARQVEIIDFNKMPV